jgi:hypothetical protein
MALANPGQAEPLDRLAGAIGEALVRSYQRPVDVGDEQLD